MLTYVVTSNKQKVIDGLGVFAAGETRTFTKAEADHFRRVRGVQLIEGNLPEGVELTILVQGEGN